MSARVRESGGPDANYGAVFSQVSTHLTWSAAPGNRVRRSERRAGVLARLVLWNGPAARREGSEADGNRSQALMTLRSTPANGNRLLDVTGAAAYLGVSPRFMRRLVAERRITFVKLGRHVRFDIADLDHFIDSGRVEAVEPRRSRSPLGRVRSA
jgi:excisionase family DNA binding protein